MDSFKGYLGAEMNLRLTKMKAEGRDVINLRLGDPDVTPLQHLLDALRDAVSHPDHHHYPSFYSIKPLKEAIAGWYGQRFGVELDANSEVLPLLGSSEGLFLIHLCLLDVGDIALAPDPSYPSYEAGVKVAGAKEVGIEFHSLSKSYNCCGWRTGMLVGNKDVIAGMGKIKSHSDRGMYYPMQVAATRALNGPIDFMEDRNQVFKDRRDVVVRGLREIGLEVQSPEATFYVWATIPKGHTSQDFCFEVLERVNVWMIPGSMYGKYGEGYLRIALTHPVERLAEAMGRLKKLAGSE
jgi:aspartate/methionine/tyrosine aminotransferase